MFTRTNRINESYEKINYLFFIFLVNVFRQVLLGLARSHPRDGRILCYRECVDVLPFVLLFGSIRTVRTSTNITRQNGEGNDP